MPERMSTNGELAYGESGRRGSARTNAWGKKNVALSSLKDYFSNLVGKDVFGSAPRFQWWREGLTRTHKSEGGGG